MSSNQTKTSTAGKNVAGQTNSRPHELLVMAGSQGNRPPGGAPRQAPRPAPARAIVSTCHICQKSLVTIEDIQRHFTEGDCNVLSTLEGIGLDDFTAPFIVSTPPAGPAQPRAGQAQPRPAPVVTTTRARPAQPRTGQAQPRPAPVVTTTRPAPVVTTTRAGPAQLRAAPVVTTTRAGPAQPRAAPVVTTTRVSPTQPLSAPVAAGGSRAVISINSTRPVNSTGRVQNLTSNSAGRAQNVSRVRLVTNTNNVGRIQPAHSSNPGRMQSLKKPTVGGFTIHVTKNTAGGVQSNSRAPGTDVQSGGTPAVMGNPAMVGTPAVVGSAEGHTGPVVRGHTGLRAGTTLSVPTSSKDSNSPAAVTTPAGGKERKSPVRCATDVTAAAPAETTTAIVTAPSASLVTPTSPPVIPTAPPVTPTAPPVIPTTPPVTEGPSSNKAAHVASSAVTIAAKPVTDDVSAVDTGPSRVAPIPLDQSASCDEERRGEEEPAQKRSSEEEDCVVILCDHCGEDITDPGAEAAHDQRCQGDKASQEEDEEDSDGSDSESAASSSAASSDSGGSGSQSEDTDSSEESESESDESGESDSESDNSETSTSDQPKKPDGRNEDDDKSEQLATTGPPEGEESGSPKRHAPESPERLKSGSPERQRPESPKRQKSGSPERLKSGSPERQKPESPKRQKSESPERTKSCMDTEPCIGRGEAQPEVTCNLCNEIFAGRGELEEHKKTHVLVPFCDETKDPVLPYRCSQCGREFRSRDKLASHRKSHRDAADKTCARCGKEFATSFRLNYHLERVCGVKKALYTPKTTSCPVCAATFSSQDLLACHVAAGVCVPPASDACARPASGACASPASGTLAAISSMIVDQVMKKQPAPLRNHVCHACDVMFASQPALDSHVCRPAGTGGALPKVIPDVVRSPSPGSGHARDEAAEGEDPGPPIKRRHPDTRAAAPSGEGSKRRAPAPSGVERRRSCRSPYSENVKADSPPAENRRRTRASLRQELHSSQGQSRGHRRSPANVSRPDGAVRTSLSSRERAHCERAYVKLVDISRKRPDPTDPGVSHVARATQERAACRDPLPGGLLPTQTPATLSSRESSSSLVPDPMVLVPDRAPVRGAQRPLESSEPMQLSAGPVTEPRGSPSHTTSLPGRQGVPSPTHTRGRQGTTPGHLSQIQHTSEDWEQAAAGGAPGPVTVKTEPQEQVPMDPVTVKTEPQEQVPMDLERFVSELTKQENGAPQIFLPGTEVLGLDSHTNDPDLNFQMTYGFGVSCPVCNKTFPSVASLASHKQVHMRTTSFSCPKCKKIFYDRYKLNYHTERVCGRKKKKHAPEEQTTIHKCDVCGIEYKSPYMLTYHKLHKHGSQSNSSQVNSDQDNNSPVNSSQDNIIQANSNQAKSNQDNSSQDNSNQAKSNQDNNSQDSSNQATSNQDNNSQDNSNQTKSNQDNSSQANNSQDNSNQANSNHDNSSHDNSSHDNSSQANNSPVNSNQAKSGEDDIGNQSSTGSQVDTGDQAGNSVQTDK